MAARSFLRRFEAGGGPLPEGVLLLVAHPDDEVIALGGSLPRLPNLRVLVATDGAPRDMADAARIGLGSAAAYAEVRRRESEAALRLAGVGPDRVERLGLVDKEVVAALPELAARVAAALAARPVELLVTHVYEGGHPDHDALALGARLALRRLAQGGAPAPALLEFPAYHARDASGAQAWQAFPAGAPAGAVRRLDPAERDLKARMLGAHASQAGILGAVGTEAETLREAAPDGPDFDRPPQPWPPLYEGFGWAFSFLDWRARARAALEAEGIPCPPS